jgi:putative restriction endonuclease
MDYVQTRPAEDAEVFYPDSDGQPMAESDETRELMVECIGTLEDHFAAAPDVYVSGNLLVYYERGNPKASVAPDVLVARGVGKHRRRTYQTWVEGKMPDLVIEIASETTWQRDMLFKSMLYFSLGVREYFLFDSTASRFDGGPLLGLMRDALAFRAIEPDERGRVPSEVLGLELAAEEGHLRFYDPETGRRLPTRVERAEEAEARAGRESEARLAAEEELKQLRAEMARLRERGAEGR